MKVIYDEDTIYYPHRKVILKADLLKIVEEAERYALVGDGDFGIFINKVKKLLEGE